MPDNANKNQPKPSEKAGGSDTNQLEEQVELERTLETLKKELDETYRGFSEISSELYDTASALETSEKRLRLAAEGAGIGIWDWDVGSDKLVLSASWLRLLGVDQTPAELNWSFWQDRIHPDDSAKVTRTLRKYLVGEIDEFQVEHRLRTADGDWNWYLALGRVAAHGAGNSKRLAGILLDIHPRKQAEEKARLSALRFESISKSAIDGILSLDEEGRIIGLNPALAALLDYSEEEVLGQFAGLIVPENLQDKSAKGLNRVFRGGPDKYMGRVSEAKLVGKDGRVIPVEFSLAAWETEDDTCHTAIIRDITERKEAEEEIRRSEEFLQTLLDISPIPINIVSKKDGRFLMANKALQELHRLTEAEMLERYTSEVYIDLKDREKLVRQVKKTGRLSGEELLMRRLGTGEEWWSAFYATEIEYEGQEALLTVTQDITERKEAEEELRRARDAAEEATRAKDLFLAAMSHEIRTPMNGVVGMIELMESTALANEQRQMLETAKDSSFALLSIINDILDFSKIEAGKMEIEKVAFNLRKAADAVGEMLGVMAAEKGLPLVVHVQPEVSRLLLGDQVRIRQILLNLTGNAIKFTEAGEVHVGIRLAQTHKDGAVDVVYEIKDSGIGMTEEQIGRLFKPFEQAETSTTRRYGGTGLGLSIVAHLVKLMDGTIEVESTPGRGSTFRVTLRHSVPKVEAGEAARVDLGRMKMLALSKAGSRVDLLAQLLKENDQGSLTRVSPTTKKAALLKKLAAAEKSGDPYGLVYLSVEVETSQQDQLRKTIEASKELKNIPRFVVERHNAPITQDIPGSVLIPPTPYTESNLVRALSIVLGKASPDFFSPTEVKGRAAKVPSLEEAEAAGTLILVAEDNKTNQEVIGLQLAVFGYAHEIADDGAIALRMLSERAYGLLLSDVHMPNMDGYQLTQAIRTEEKKSGTRLPIVAITANALHGEGDRCMEAGMDAYMAKPVRMKEFRECLKKWLPKAAEEKEQASPQEDQEPAAASEGDRPDDAVVELDVLIEMFGDDEETLKSILAEFPPAAWGCIEELDSAYDAKNWAGVGDAGHKLKSSARTIGANQLADTCEALEEAGKAGDKKTIKKLMPKLRPAMEAVEAYITERE